MVLLRIEKKTPQKIRLAAVHITEGAMMGNKKQKDAIPKEPKVAYRRLYRRMSTAASGFDAVTPKGRQNNKRPNWAASRENLSFT